MSKKTFTMHDWTLLNISVDWKSGVAILMFRDTQSKELTLTADGLVDLHVPRRNEWGESVSVNEVIGPNQNNSTSSLVIEIQSGDQIQIEAKSILMPY